MIMSMNFVKKIVLFSGKINLILDQGEIVKIRNQNFIS